MGQSSLLEGVNLLDLAPVRAADWFEDGGQIVVIRRQPRFNGWRTPFDWMGYLMAARKLRLDEKGSFVWRLLDGANTVLAVATRLRDEFGEDAEPAEERVGILIRQLRAEELLQYPGVDAPRELGADVGGFGG